MRGKSFRVTAIITVALMVFAMFSGCKKDDSDSSTSPTKTSQATAAKTSAASTKTTTSAKAQSTSSTSSNTEKTNEVNTDNTGQSQVENSGDAIVEDSVSVSIPEDSFANTITEVLEHEKIDLGGRTVVMSTWIDTTLPNPDPNTGRSYILYNRLKAAEKEYNFKLEYKIQATNYVNEIQQSVLAGVSYADVAVMQTQQAFPVLVENNIIVPWDDYVDFENPVIKANPIMYQGLSWKGKHYGTPMGEYERAFADFLFNREMLQREGLPDVLDLVEAGQWTWEKVLEMAIACTKDIDGDGILDQWGITSNSEQSFVTGVLISNGVRIIDDLGNGFQSNLKSAPAQRALQFVSDLALTHKVYNTSTDYKNTYGKGKVAFFWGDNIMYMQGTFLPMGVQSHVAPHPMGVDVDWYQNSNTAAMYAILSTCDVPRELAIIFTEACMTWDENLNPIPQLQELFEKTGQTRPWEAENARYTTEKEYVLAIKNMAPYFTTNFTNGFPNISTVIRDNLAKPIMNGSKSVAQAVDAITPMIESIIDAYR